MAAWGRCAVSVIAFQLVACGGDSADPSSGSAAVKRPVALAAAANTPVFSGNRANYVITRTASGYTVANAVGDDAGVAVGNVDRIQFADMSVNLGMDAKLQKISPSDLKLLIELYIAFFNRVPDADGLAYWIDQYAAGQGIDQIAQSFYSAALEYSTLTGYSASMSTGDFVRLIYKNVLGRSGTTAPADADVQYWSQELDSGRATKGSLVRTMLASAHSFTNDATWGWVASLLDNKASVGNVFAVQQGLNYNTTEDTINKTMAIAAAIQPGDTTAARQLIEVTDSAMQYSYVTPTVGDYQTYTSTETTGNGTSTFNYTKQVTVVNTDGSYTHNHLNGSNAITRIETRSATGRRQTRTYTSNNNLCTYIYNTDTSYPRYVGKTYSHSWTYSCTAGYRETAAQTSSIVAMEQISVPAGTFNALKIQTTINFTESNDSQLTGGPAGTASYKIDETCWWSPELGVNIKCTDSYTYTGSTPKGYVTTVTDQISAYRKQ